MADEAGQGKPETIVWREPAPRGKMDLVVDINFRMDTSALYSDIVLPTASWYEKNDLNSTDMHSFIHPLSAAVPPVWEAKSDWEIFKALAKKVSEIAPDAFSGPVTDVVMRPLMHDTADELGQMEVLDWREGECEAIPGKTMPHFHAVERDYTQIYDKFISYGPRAREQGISANGVHIPIARFYDELLENPSDVSADATRLRTVEWGGKRYPSLEDALDAANLDDYLGVQRFRYGRAEESNRIGQVTGLAWTEVGGDLLTIESAVVPGKGKLQYTGQLGEVMQESAQADRVERAVASVLEAGFRTADIQGPGTTLLGTREMGAQVVAAL